MFMKLDISYYRDFFANTWEFYELYHNYYEGIQEYYHQKFYKNKLLDDLLRTVKSNICKPVIDLIDSRLNIIDIQAKKAGNSASISLIDEGLIDLAIFNRAMKEALIYGDSFIGIWEDGFHYHSPMNSAIEYSSDGQVISGLSYRQNKDNTEIYFYSPDFIFVGEVKGTSLPDSFEPSSIYENLYAPYVPLVHFYNDLPFTFRHSELVNVIPLQRVLNKTLQDRALASELSAFKQKWISGMQYDVDENGKPISPFESDIAKIFVSTSSETKFGEFSETPLDNYTGVIDSLHKEISMVSSIPLHLFNLATGNFPSGQALQEAEAPFVSKISNKQRLFERPVVDCLKIAFSDYTDFNVIFQSASSESETLKLDNALKKLELGVPKDIVLKELGY